jgi:hypothetical protein
MVAVLANCLAAAADDDVCQLIQQALPTSHWHLLHAVDRMSSMPGSSSINALAETILSIVY